jgi:signal transduction histidine kinase
VIRGFRGRLIVAFIVLVGVTAGLVTVFSYVLTRSSLRDQLVGDSVARTEFNVTVLAAPDQLPAGAGPEEFAAGGLADRFLLRGSFGVFVEFDDGQTFASSLGLLGAGDLLSADLRAIVARGEYGYEFVTLDDDPALVVGARRPVGGPDFYFFFSAVEVESASAQLGRVLWIAGIAVLVLGALGAGALARTVLRPVRAASRAAETMAGGDLGVRVATGASDELGRLAVAFNTMAESLQEQMAALVEAGERERRFVADVSHELRTPLTALVNEAAHLRSRLDALPEPDRRVGEMLVADVDRLRRLVEDLLEISRLDAGPAVPDLATIAPGPFLEAVVADRYPRARLDLPGDTDRVVTDPRALERIVGNLLDNARRHAPDAPVRVSARVAGGMLHVEVADGGPGVPPAALPHLFERFYTADPARGGGSGLGLAIARRHARRLGGDLTVRPGSPHGLTFDLVVPVTEPLRAGDGAEKGAPHPGGEGSESTRRTP